MMKFAIILFFALRVCGGTTKTHGDKDETSPVANMFQDNIITTRKLEGPPGLLFIPGEEIVFTSTAWHLAFSLNLTGMGADLKTMKRIFEEAKSNRSNSVDFRMMKAVEQSLKSAEESYGYLMQEAQQTIPSITKDTATKKRSLLNPISWITGSLGSIARELFGVASAEDVERMNSYLDILAAKDEKINTLQKLHLTVIKKIQGEIELQKRDVSTLVNMTGILFDTLLPSVKDRSNFQNLVVFLHGEMIATLRAFKSTIDQYLRIIELLDRGYISPQVIPTKDLSEAIDHIQRNLPQQMTMIYGTEKKDLYPYYHGQLAYRIPGSGDIRGVLRIPMATPNSKYRMYKVIPFPTRMDKNPLKRYKWQGTRTFVALTPDQKNYVELGPWFMETNCLKGPPRICPVKMAFTTDPETDCLSQLLIGKTKATAQPECRFDLVNENVTVIEAIGVLDWALSTNENVTMSPTCMDLQNPNRIPRREKSLKLTGEIIITIPRHCSAIIGKYMIPIRLRVTSGLKDIQTQTDPMEYSSILTEDQEQELEGEYLHEQFMKAYQEMAKMRAETSGFDHDNQDVHEIIQRMGNISEEIDKIRPGWFHDYVSYTGWTFFVICVITGLGVIVYYRMKMISWTRALIPERVPREVDAEMAIPLRERRYHRTSQRHE